VTTRRTEILLWLSLFGAPVAWAGSHFIGWGVSEANCEPVDRVWGVAFNTWEIVLLALAVALAVAGLVAATITYNAVKGVDKDSPGPAGRLWLLSISSIVTSSLLLVIILLTHVGALILGHCQQG
jgi:hypothetical protein